MIYQCIRDDFAKIYQIDMFLYNFNDIAKLKCGIYLGVWCPILHHLKKHKYPILGHLNLLKKMVP
jgi:hypothetical protein